MVRNSEPYRLADETESSIQVCPTHPDRIRPGQALLPSRAAAFR